MRSSNLSATPGTGYPAEAGEGALGTKKHPLPNPLPLVGEGTNTDPLPQVGEGINTGKQDREIVWHTPEKHLCTQ
jgi:hypothetical protein